MADKSDIVLDEDTVGIRSSGESPVLDIEGGNHWNLDQSDGDVRIGKGDNRLTIGVSLGGAGEGTSRLRAKGDSELLKLGAGDRDPVTIDPNGLNVDGSLTVKDSDNYFNIESGNITALSKESNKGWAFVDKLYVENGVRQNLTPIEGEGGSWNLGTSDSRWGTLYVDDGVNKSSDRRLKTDIRDLEGGLDAVLDLRPVSYKRRDDGDDTHLGFVGQEVADVVPEVVNDPEDGYLGLDYTELVAVLVDAVQDQQAEKDALEDRVDDLEERLEALEDDR